MNYEHFHLAENSTIWLVYHLCDSTSAFVRCYIVTILATMFSKYNVYTFAFIYCIYGAFEVLRGISTSGHGKMTDLLDKSQE